MKKINTGLLILCICFAISCTRKAPANAGSWTLQGETYLAGVAARTDTPGIALAAVSTYGNYSVFFFFNSYPTIPGTYTVVNSITPTTGQVGILFGSGQGGGLYVPIDSTSSQAAVTVSGGKVSISVPSVMLVYQESYYRADTALFTATIHQTQ